MRLTNKILFSILIVFLAIGCTKKTGSVSLLQTTDLYPLSVGKVFIYRMDSTLLNNARTGFIVSTYLAKDSVESQYYDATGRLSYRIYRYISDTANLNGWNYAATIVSTFDANHVEYTENNLKFVTISQPIVDGGNWYGNEFINTTDADNNGNYPYQYYSKWLYTFQNCNQPYTVIHGTFDSTYTIVQQDDISPSSPVPINGANPTLPYQSKNYSVEIYAKNTGLIYKEFLHWTWQGSSYTDNPLNNDGLSYGIKLNLIAVK